MAERRPAAGASAVRRVPRRHHVLALLGLGLLIAPGAAATGAAWTDDVHAAAPVSAGSWSTGPSGEPCEVVRVADQQVDPAYGCELVQRSAAWDQAAQPHQLHVVLDVRYTYPPGVYVLPSDRQVWFSTSLEVPGQPDWWTWDEAVVDASTDPAPTLTTACADLPRVAGTLPPGYQWGTHWLVTMTPGPGGSLCR